MYTEKELKVKELINLHLEKVGNCLSCFKGCIEAFFKGQKSAAEQIHENCDYAESEADIIRRKIADILYSGAFLPLARKDIYMLSQAIDEIANSAERASDTIVFQQPEIPSSYLDGFINIVKETYEMFISFQEAVSKFMPDEFFHDYNHVNFIREKIYTIIEMESEIDHKEESLIREIYASDLPLARKNQLETLLRRITSISDEIEDAADNLNILLIGEKI